MSVIGVDIFIFIADTSMQQKCNYVNLSPDLFKNFLLSDGIYSLKPQGSRG